MPTHPQKSRPTPLADLVAGAVDPALARLGFSQSSLILHWDDIVGERIASCSEPIKLQWPPRPARRADDSAIEPATLVLRVSGAMALDVQHEAPQLIARVNAHLGWRAVGKIAIRQGPLTRATRPATRPTPDPMAVARAEKAVAGVEDEALRRALAELGAHVMAASDREP
jgi:hypothetical protein